MRKGNDHDENRELSIVSIFIDIKAAQNHYNLFSPETTYCFVGCVYRVLGPMLSSSIFDLLGVGKTNLFVDT